MKKGDYIWDYWMDNRRGKIIKVGRDKYRVKKFDGTIHDIPKSHARPWANPMKVSPKRK